MAREPRCAPGPRAYLDRANGGVTIAAWLRFLHQRMLSRQIEALPPEPFQVSVWSPSLMIVSTVGRQRAARSLISIAAVLAVVVMLALTSIASPASAASPSHGSSRRADRARTLDEVVPKRAVIVVGPVGSSTPKYKEKGNAIAAAAAAHGMEVTRIFTPNAVWADVVAAATGADLFVYLGHGNGWPSPNPPFQEDTKDGLGLNPSRGTDNTTTKYYGANRLRESIRLAPNAIVILNKLCYAEGNGEQGMPIPTTSVARQRVDNFASGFLAIGARAVFALGWQPGENIVSSLFSETPMTMDGIFMSRFGSNGDGSYKPYYGWVGWKPGLYFDSERTPGAIQHLDPDPKEGFLRAVTGDLGFTNHQWLGSVDSSDTEAPVLTELTGDQAANTIPASENAVPVFTPNGDGLSDEMTFRHKVSEGAFLSVQIARQDGTKVRRFTSWSEPGPGTSVWDGRNDSGKIAKDGKYDVTVTPRDSAGNVGAALTTSVKLLTAMRSPSAAPALFDPTDGDLLAATTTLGVTLNKEASITLRIVDASGDIVRHALADQVMPAGVAGFDWDGLDDDGAPLPTGLYTGLVTATTDAGTYSHRTVVRLMPFNLRATLKVRTGQSQRLVILTAEPVDGKPVIEIKQPGMAAYTLTVSRLAPDRFAATWRVRSGADGKASITVSSTDTDGGSQTQTFRARIQ